MKKLIALSVLSLGIVFLVACSQQQTSQNQNTNQQVTQPQNIVYTNSTYDFTLTFPQTWEDYTAKSRTIDWGTLGTSDSIDFGFSAQDSLFNISVHAKSQWQKFKSEEGPTPTYLGENSQYVFGYAQAQDAANDEMVARMTEVQEIVKTFVLTKQQVEKEQEARSLADCSKLGSWWTLFSNSGTSLSFCHKTSWGTTELKETEISPEARKGTVYYISFSKSANNYPLLSYSTLDFQKLGDSDVSAVIDWKALDFSKSEVELALLFTDENATAQKLTVNDKQVLKVKRDFVEPLSQERITPLDYFMPNVVINGTTYNLHIIGSPEQEADLDKLLESMVF